MESDNLLKQWTIAKQTCYKIIEISINANIHSKLLGKQSSQQFMKVYDTVYRLCSNRETEETRVVMVYKDYKDMLKNALLTMNKQLNKQQEICKLKMLKKVWDAYEDIVKRLKNMFAYLNRPYHIKEGNLQELDRTGIVLIVSTLFTEESLHEYESIYYKQLAKIRCDKDFVDSQILKDYIDILDRIHMRLTKKQTRKTRTLYTDFKQKYLKESRSYYKSYFHKLKQLSASEYFLETNELFLNEKRVSQECSGIASETLINKVFAEQLLQKYFQKLVKDSKGFIAILRNQDSSIIKVIADLYKQLTDSIDGFKQPFQIFIYQEFTSVLLEARAELALKGCRNRQLLISTVKKIISKNNQLISLLKISFMKYGQFNSYYKNGLQRALSHNILQLPIEQILATYIDAVMKIAFSNQDQLMQEITDIINIFECMENKDLFQMKYLHKLSKSIMLLTVEGLNNHEAFLYRLKMHSGIKMTERLEMMIDEFKISLENDKEFEQAIEIRLQEERDLRNKGHRCNMGILSVNYRLSIRVFSEAVWPQHNIVSFSKDKLPEPFLSGLQLINHYEQLIIKKKKFKISFLDSRIRWAYYMDQDDDYNKQSCNERGQGQKLQIEGKEPNQRYQETQYKSKDNEEVREKLQRNTSQDHSFMFSTNGVQAVLLHYIYYRRPERVSLNILQEVFHEVKPEIIKSCLIKMSQTNQNILKMTQNNDIIDPSKNKFYEFNRHLHTKKKMISYDFTGIEELQLEEQKLFQKNELGRDRELTIDANMAKLMKAKKILSFDQVVVQTIKMIKVFTPSIKDIKKSLQRLLIKELLARDERDFNLIKYNE